ncbi:MAG: HRDC domain-containing protein [Pirellulales bacterium]|nr:HRDC domain-containing protein [Pirellulales bacterium]
MPTPTITDTSELALLCKRLESAPFIGIDTEFVSEDTFYPELCLIQVATHDDCAAIDTLAIEDVTPFWKMLCTGDHVTILHAGREELNFIHRSIQAVPKRLFDVQIAAGFCSHDYPSAYGSVVSRFLGHQPAKGEQRTDWRKRPLTHAQINYALEDVRYLLPLQKRLTALLDEHGRRAWFEDEMMVWQNEVVSALGRRDWRRTSGIGRLGPRNLAIVRELWNWRYEEARRRNYPQKRLLRDDLIVELAKRKVDNPEQIMAIRGMERSSVRRKADELAECVRRGLAAPPEYAPRSPRKSMPSQLSLVGQFLAPALGTICHRAEIAASMVGTASDVRELIAHHMGYGQDRDGCPPVLATGWRAELVGNLIYDLLDGKKSIRIVDVKQADPLRFEDVV